MRALKKEGTSKVLVGVGSQGEKEEAKKRRSEEAKKEDDNEEERDRKLSVSL